MLSSLSRRRNGWSRRWCGAVAVVVVACLALSPLALGKPKLGQYAQSNFFSDVPGEAAALDPQLVNPWGLALSPTGGAAWVANNGTDVATLYTGAVGDPPTAVVKASLTVTIPSGAPTGAVFNPSTSPTDFVVSSGTDSGRAVFLFSSETGFITGWNPAVPSPPVPSTMAQTAFSLAGAIFKGLAIADTDSGAFLYATDFHHGRIVVLNSAFQPVTLAGDFTDPDIPPGFAPFGIKVLGGLIYVTYAKQDAAAEDDVAGHGNGFVSVFNTDGTFVRRFASGAPLNSPWGMALAPTVGFGDASGALLIGNFGDGRINAFDPQSGEFLGALRTDHGQRLEIDGLWGLEFGNGVTIGTRQTLLFTAGIAGEAHGLFGGITAVPAG